MIKTDFKGITNQTAPGIINLMFVLPFIFITVYHANVHTYRTSSAKQYSWDTSSCGKFSDVFRPMILFFPRVISSELLLIYGKRGGAFIAVTLSSHHRFIFAHYTFISTADFLSFLYGLPLSFPGLFFFSSLQHLFASIAAPFSLKAA